MNVGAFLRLAVHVGAWAALLLLIGLVFFFLSDVFTDQAFDIALLAWHSVKLVENVGIGAIVELQFNLRCVLSDPCCFRFAVRD